MDNSFLKRLHMANLLISSNVPKKLTHNQFAFRKLHSTITTLIGVSDHWHSNIDNKKTNFALFLNLKKAFDTVGHEILISKLAKYGVTSNDNKWIEP